MAAQGSHAGWLDAIKDSLHWNGIKEKFYELQPSLITLGIYTGVGFIAGFLLKKFGKIVVMIIVALVILAILHQFNIVSVSINWLKVNDLFGLSKAPALDHNALCTYAEWVKNNPLSTLFFLLGFVMGLCVA